MIAGNALRHQMILPEQQYIYDYWRSKCTGGQLPHRSDINPADIREHLPMVSLVECRTEEQGRRFKYRLAGTGFWELFEAEITGKYIDELPIGDRKDYWERVLSRIVDLRRPSAGVTNPGTPCRSHLAQFWIRLPLVDDEGKISLIMGYDHLVKAKEAQAAVGAPNKIFA